MQSKFKVGITLALTALLLAVPTLAQTTPPPATPAVTAPSTPAASPAPAAVTPPAAAPATPPAPTTVVVTPKKDTDLKLQIIQLKATNLKIQYLLKAKTAELGVNNRYFLAYLKENNAVESVKKANHWGDSVKFDDQSGVFYSIPAPLKPGDKPAPVVFPPAPGTADMLQTTREGIAAVRADFHAQDLQIQLELTPPMDALQALALIEIEAVKKANDWGDDVTYDTDKAVFNEKVPPPGTPEKTAAKSDATAPAKTQDVVPEPAATDIVEALPVTTGGKPVARPVHKAPAK